MTTLLLRGIRSKHLVSPSALLAGARKGDFGFSTVAFEEIEAAATNNSNVTVQTAFILHGLLGSARNWRTFARQLASSILTPSSVWRIVLLDLRNHGKSNGIQGLDPPHDMANAARDLATLIEDQRWVWPNVVIGHSMGGKVALEYVASCARGDYGGSAILPKQVPPFVWVSRSLWQGAFLCLFHQVSKGDLDILDSLPSACITTFSGVIFGTFSYKADLTLDVLHSCVQEQLWVLDSVPGKVNADNDDGEVERVLGTLQSLRTPFPSRRWLVEHMTMQGFSKPLSEWIGSNVKKANTTGEQMTWTFNLDGCLEMFHSYRRTDYWPLLESPPKGLEIVVVRAEKSDRWTPQVVQKLEGLAKKNGTRGADVGQVLYQVLPNAGHWVHADNPKGLLDIMVHRMKNLAQ